MGGDELGSMDGGKARESHLESKVGMIIIK